MSDSPRELIRDLHAAGVGGDLLGRVAEMIAVGPGASVELVAAERSPGAIRTARWRARRAASQASQRDVTSVTGDGQVTAPEPYGNRLRMVENSGNPGASYDLSGAPDLVLPLMAPVTGVTPVTLRDARRQKESPPTPPLRKTTSPKGVPASQPHRPNWRHSADPIFHEIEAMRGRSAPTDKAGGWEFKTALLIEAEQRIASRVTSLPSHEPQAHAQGPPKALVTG